ncbi:MAG TPA: P-II family nitrogen regulator [Clostridia bacterium]|nr:P-II family nitrogen regulator [Clostridia bacterium]
MHTWIDGRSVELIVAIVNFGSASKLVKEIKKHGVTGATVTLGRGTVGNHLMDFLGLSDIRKEIVFMAAERETAFAALEAIDREFEFRKPNHGIAFTLSVCGVVGAKSIPCDSAREQKEAEQSMYHIITTIVDKGKAEDVIEAATKAGSKGGTIMNARGSGIHETSRLFSMEIEPEKEIVLILSEAHATEAIVASIRRELEIDKAGNGIIYVQNTGKTYGIYKGENLEQ